MKHLEEQQLASEQVWQGRLLDVRRDRVRLPDGSESAREYIVHPGAVVVIPVLPNGKLLFELQYRYPMRQTFLELPAGKIDPHELVAETARRELLEETGHVAEEWIHVGVMHPCIGYSNERIEIFLARKLTSSGAQRLDDGEFLDLVELSLPQAIEKIRCGELTDAKTITALFWAEKVLGGAWPAVPASR